MNRNFLLDPAHGTRVFFTDGCSDLTHEEKVKYGIWPEVAPFAITVNEENVDISDLDYFYDRLADGTYAAKALKTASPSPAAIMNLIEDIVKATPEHVEIVYLGVSHHVSAGTHNATHLAMIEAQEEYPNRKFTCIDTTCVSNGMALALQKIATYDGEDFEAYAKMICERSMHLFTMRELGFSASSGRFNAFERVGLQTIEKMRLSPVMFFPSDDKLSNAGVARGDTILKDWIDHYYINRISNDAIIRVAYGHRDEEARALKFIERLKAAGDITDEQIQLARVGCAIGAHTGPTVLSVFFLQKDPRPVTRKDYKKPKRDKE